MQLTEPATKAVEDTNSRQAKLHASREERQLVRRDLRALQKTARFFEAPAISGTTSEVSVGKSNLLNSRAHSNCFAQAEQFFTFSTISEGYAIPPIAPNQAIKTLRDISFAKAEKA